MGSSAEQDMKANVNGIDTYYEIHGREGAPWIVFSHSLACNLHMWDAEIERYKDRFRILAYDTRGHGQSAVPPGPYTLDAMADDLHSLLAHVGAAKPHFVGVSMGGMIGQTAALKYPGIFASMTLADTTSRYPAEAQKVWAERTAIARTQGVEPLLQATLERWFTAPFREKEPATVARIAALIRSTPGAGYAGCGSAISQINVTSRLKEIRVPVLVICGEDDPATPPAMSREIVDNLPGAKLVMIPKAAHLSSIEHPQAFNRALGEFLASVTR
jgi:3-oxoadipate enol-lactonase